MKHSEFLNALVDFGLNTNNDKLKILSLYLVWWFKFRYQGCNEDLISNLKDNLDKALDDLQNSEVQMQITLLSLTPQKLKPLLEINLDWAFTQLFEELKKHTQDFKEV